MKFTLRARAFGRQLIETSSFGDSLHTSNVSAESLRQKKQMQPLRRKHIMLHKLLAIAIFATAPAAVATDAMAACSVPKSWSLRQSNGFVVRLQNLNQNGTSFSGYATTRGGGGDVQGKMRTNGKLIFTVSWGSGGAVGEYTADVDDENGRVSAGSTFDQRSPGNTAAWSTRATFQCQ